MNELQFRHVDDNYSAKDDTWHFVYLHGAAENLVESRLNEDSHAADLCIGNQPMPQLGRGQTLVLDCTVYGEPAKCVLRNREYTQGRIALVSDEAGLAHAMDPDAWG